MIGYNKFVKYIHSPITQFIKGEKINQNLEQLEKSQFFSSDEMQNFQLKKLQKIIKHAFKNTEYYNKLFKEKNINPNEIKSFEDIKRIPFLTKNIIRQQGQNLYYQSYNGKTFPCTTSGSTGKPINFAVTSEYSSWDWASRWRARRWYGIDIGDPEVAMWGRPVYNKVKKYWDPIKAIFRNTLLLSGFEVSEKTLYLYSKLLFFYKPKYIYSYSTTIYQLANYIKKHYPKINKSRLKAIFVTAETLYPHQRQIIEEVFNVPVSNEYGCSEIGGFVYECPQGNWHISTENVYLEFISIDNSPKEIVATSLTNFYMPFIRYRIGDLGEFIDKSCSCGINLPIMKFNAGKTTDVIILKNGRKLTSEIFLYLTRAMVDKKCQPFNNFKIIQKDFDKFEVIFEKSTNFTEMGLETFRQLFLDLLKDDNILILFSEVSKIPNDSTGKFRYFVSELKKQPSII